MNAKNTGFEFYLIVIRVDNNSNYLFYLQKAEAQLAYELQAAKIQQRIRNEEIQIQVKLSVKIVP